MEVNAVAQHLDDEAVVMGRDLTDEICQLQRHSRGDFVARLLRQLRVARQVGEHAGLWTPFLPAMNPGALERRHEVVEHVLQLELLGVAPEQPAQEVFPRSADANTDLAKRRLERRIVAQALPPERLLDRLMQIVGLELGDLSGAFPQTRARRRMSPASTPAVNRTGTALMKRSSASRTSSSGPGRGNPNATYRRSSNG